MRKVAIAIILAGLATPAVAADDPLLARLAGEWIGRGVFRQAPDADIERIYCKVANALADGGATLVQKGRCAVADKSVAVEIKITALGSGRYSGTGGGLGLASRGQATLTGTGRATHLDLAAQLIDTQTEKTATATAAIDVLPEGGYRIRARATDKQSGATYTASEVVFTAK